MSEAPNIDGDVTPAQGDLQVENEKLRAELAQLRKAQPEPQPASATDDISVEKDLMGTVHIKVSDFDFIQIQYDYRYTDNAHQNRLTKQIVDLISVPSASAAQSDLRPVTVTAPERIYLIVGDECPDDAEFSDLAEVPWCVDHIDGKGIEYRRTTPAGAQAQPQLNAELRESISEVAASFLAQIAERKRADADTTSTQGLPMISNDSISLVDQARQFATRAHAAVQQVRKYTGEPYINHPQEVVEILLEYGITDPVMLTAAWLHDVVEDTGVSSEAIHAMFGCEVGCLVDGLTDITVPSDGSRAVRKAKARAYLAAQSPACKTIKLADLISNTRSIAERDPVFAVTYMAEKRLMLDVLRKGDERLWEAAHALAWADQQEGHPCVVTA